ncbi:Hypothetical predicted protein [Pelobates cultripes]|uniref:Uncharacterized protein n=1 Tax=Pelobates cultripes TaxID=61616 RepID=A0AAD1SR45_PELCU|nr:Hypothetical predicted protein [Pelobates cultripes]
MTRKRFICPRIDGTHTFTSTCMEEDMTSSNPGVMCYSRGSQHRIGLLLEREAASGIQKERTLKSHQIDFTLRT